jgi:hypothetical protein
MPCWHFCAAAVGLQLVALLGSSSCISLRLQLFELYRCSDSLMYIYGRMYTKFSSSLERYHRFFLSTGFFFK